MKYAARAARTTVMSWISPEFRWIKFYSQLSLSWPAGNHGNGPVIDHTFYSPQIITRFM